MILKSCLQQLYSLDLREKLLASYCEGNLTQKEVSKLFGVSQGFLTDLLKLHKVIAFSVEINTLKKYKSLIL